MSFSSLDGLLSVSSVSTPPPVWRDPARTLALDVAAALLTRSLVEVEKGREGRIIKGRVNIASATTSTKSFPTYLTKMF
jgi:hypothetical protein